jgi:hypothetical protein
VCCVFVCWCVFVCVCVLHTPIRHRHAHGLRRRRLLRLRLLRKLRHTRRHGIRNSILGCIKDYSAPVKKNEIKTKFSTVSILAHSPYNGRETLEKLC